MHQAIRAIVIALFLVTGSSAASAVPESAPDVSALARQAQTKNLARHPYWMALMRYHHSMFSSDSSVTSEIISSDFFLSPRGSTDPEAELAATLVAFFDEPGNEPDKHAQCRFVARYKWLRKALDWGTLTPPSVICHEFGEWSLNGQVESLSLIFATSYLSNPASVFGHLVLKFNASRMINATELLDQTVNYGAFVSDNENGVVYVIKGLFGGYYGGFSSDRFYYRNHMYSENELRDMWEYELALTRDQVDQIVSHSWELLGKKFVYYFTNENCAYQMARLLELVIEQPLLPPSVPWSVPAEIFDRLASAKKPDDTPVVRTFRRIPSRQNRFYEKFSTFSPAQKTLTQKLVNSELGPEDQEYQELPENEKIEIIDTLIDYYDFRIIEESNNAAHKKIRQNLLIERAQLAPRGPQVPKASSEILPPHQGPVPSMVQLSLFHNSQFGSGIGLRLRPAYYDLLSLEAGHIPNSSLSMFDFRTAYVDDRFRLRSLDFASIETLNLSRTSLPGDGGLAWKVKFGFENQDLSCIDCMIFNLVGGVGKARAITERASVYGMIDLNAQTEHQDSGRLGVTVRLGVLGSPNMAWKYLITTGKHAYLDGTRADARILRWENRLGAARDWDVRFSYEMNVEREYQLATSFYW